jgi:hypothetical protein
MESERWMERMREAKLPIPTVVECRAMEAAFTRRVRAHTYTSEEYVVGGDLHVACVGVM